MAPLTAVPPADTVIALLPTLAALTGALTTTTTCGFTGTALAPFAGLTCTTVGELVTAPNPVVKLENKNCRPWPSRSRMLPVASIKYPVEGDSGGLGVNVAVSPSADTATVPGTGMPVACGKT